MHFHCLTGRHVADIRVVGNQGLYFSHCSGCGKDLVRSGARWKPVPAGFRVVWKPVERAGRAAANLPTIIAGGMAAAPRAPRRGRPMFSLTSFALAALRLLVREGFDRFRTARAARPAPALALPYSPA